METLKVEVGLWIELAFLRQPETKLLYGLI